MRDCTIAWKTFLCASADYSESIPETASLPAFHWSRWFITCRCPSLTRLRSSSVDLSGSTPMTDKEDSEESNAIENGLIRLHPLSPCLQTRNENGVAIDYLVYLEPILDFWGPTQSSVAGGGGGGGPICHLSVFHSISNRSHGQREMARKY